MKATIRNDYDTEKLFELGYGDVTNEGKTIEMTPEEVNALAYSCDGTVAEIELARV